MKQDVEVQNLISEPDSSPTATVAERFPHLNHRMPVYEYNFEHFRPRHLGYDAKATILEYGVNPGEEAPDFRLPRVGGGEFHLESYRGRPVLLHFGSFT